MSANVQYAAGYVRISDDQKQGNNHSPAVQRAAIKRLAAQEGYVLSVVEEDHARGSKVTRAGYQRIIEAARAGTIHAVIVYMFDRWGRDGAEWLTRAKEFDRLGVPIISVQEGRDERGIMRFVRAGMAQYYSELLAQRVRPARRKGALEGTHMGPTPYGYRRVYPAWDGKGKRPPAELVIDEATAWVVRAIFERYAGGGWSHRRLARWLNDDPGVPLPLRGRAWSESTVRWLVRNVVYKGDVSFDRTPQGTYERAVSGDAFVARGRHEPIVDEALWAQAQAQCDRVGHRHSRGRVEHAHLAAGLLTCAGCGGPMRASYSMTERSQHRSYACQHRSRGIVECSAPGYRMDLAHDALLAELRRLRGHPWTPQTTRRLSGQSGSKARDAARITRGIAAERARLERHTRALTLLDDPSPEEIAAFRGISAEVSARIVGLEAQLGEMGRVPERLPELRALHARLTQAEIAATLDDLDPEHDPADHAIVRRLLLECVASARLVERHPAHKSTWLRMEVTWAEPIQVLLAAGSLTLAPPVLHVCDGRKLATGKEGAAR